MIYGYDTLKPHVDAEGYYDSNGDWHNNGGDGWGETIPCDIEQPSSGKATFLTDEAGNKVEYAYTVWLDASVQQFSIGDRVLLAVGSDAEQEYTVKGFRRYRSHAKLWV